MAQELAVGKTIKQKYENLGFHAVKMVSPPGKLFGLLVGMPGVGKSCFIQSHSDAFIINCDLSSTTNEDPQACIWPGMDSEGRPCSPGAGGTSTPIRLDWKSVLEKKNQLIEMAKNNQPRPETIIVDSLGPALALVKQYVTEKMGKKEWKELDGRRAWDDVYEQLVRFPADLRHWGYGFYYVCHLVNAKIPLGDDRYVIRPELTITDNFYKRLFPLFELVAAFECDMGTKTEMVQQKNPDGSPGPKRPKKIKYRDHYMTINDESLAGITKCRVNLPDRIQLPETDAWSFFEEQYLSA
tara:strand:- start:3557 stop:4447 length:891 start_codon:yes stop_codon:yes gene_type:complete